MGENDKKSRVGIVNLERRKYPRFTVDLPIEYCQVDSTIHNKGQAMNASEGGLLLYLPEKMKIGQHLRIKLFFSSGSDLNTIEILGEIAWEDIQFGKDWGDSRMGVKFIDISPSDMVKLKNFLKDLSE